MTKVHYKIVSICALFLLQCSSAYAWFGSTNACATSETECLATPCQVCCKNFNLCTGTNACNTFCPAPPAPAPAPAPYCPFCPAPFSQQPPSSSCAGMTCGCGNLPACNNGGGGGGGGGGGHSGGGSHGGGTSVSKPKPKVEETKPKAKVVVVTKAAVETKPKPKEKLSPTRTPPHGPHDAYLAASSGPSPAGVVFGSALVFALAGLFVGEVRRNGWGRRRAVNVNTRALSEDSRANASASDTPYASA